MGCDRSRRTTTRALALAAGFLALVPFAAEAGFSRTDRIDSDTRKKLENNTIYMVANNEVSVAASAGNSAYSMDPNTTAVIYIPAGRTLELKGGKGDETGGARLDLSGAELIKEDGDKAMFVVPLGEKSGCRFFKVRSR